MPSDRIKSAVKQKTENKFEIKKKVISVVLIMFLLFGSLTSTDVSVYGSQLGQSKQTAKTIYDKLGVDNLIDLIEIKEEDNTYYYDFVDGAEEKIDNLVEELKKGGNKSITKELLKKMIKAEVVNQLPFLKGSNSYLGSGGSASSYYGNSIAEKTWNFLIGQGYSEYAVAGLMGNIHQESGGFNPAIVENGGSGEGIGLCQWSWGRRNQLEAYAQAMGKDWSDVNLQLDFLLMELTGNKNGYTGSVDFQFIPASAKQQWENAQSPEEAATIFSNTFERPSVPMMENRIYWANKYYEIYQGTFNQSEDTNTNNSFESLDGFLFIGDSITEGLVNYNVINANYINCGVSSSTPSNWLNNQSVGGKATYSALPADGDNIKGICIMLGTNNPTQISQMKQLLEKLLDKYPNKYIFVQKAISAVEYESQTKDFNKQIQEYCKTNKYLIYIDTLSGIEYSTDGVHPTANGYKTLAQNIESAICEENVGNKLGQLEGTIRIRRVTPNKNVAEAKNSGTGAIADTTSSISDLNNEAIENYINSEATEGIWSVYAKNLATNSVKININNQKLESASLIKLFIMATAYEEIERGNLNKDEVIGDILIMINKSDNNAANRIIDKLGLPKINNYIITNGYSSTEIRRKMLQSSDNGDNYTSVVDVGNLLEKIYRGTCVSQNSSKEMLDILKTQTLKNKIPAGIPSGVETANKTGELDDVENDAAIIYKEDANYVIVVMSNNLKDTAAARNNIKEISSRVYELIGTSGLTGESNSNAEHKVAIVAGHGITRYSGTEEEVANKEKYYTKSASGVTLSGRTLNEWEITKKVANYVEKYLQPYSAQVGVVQVGYSEANWERIQKAKDKNVDAYIGIHFNSSENAAKNGVDAYYSNGDSSSQNLSDMIAKKVAESMSINNNGAISNARATSHKGELNSISNSSQCGFPSTIVTGGYMSNAGDMDVIGQADEEGLKKYAKGIVAGILEYYGIENRGLEGVTITNSQTTTTEGVNSKIYDLRYVSPERFEEYVKTNNRRALNVFTLEKETKKLIVANWSFTTEEGIKIVKSNPINYRSVVNKYTMPIEYMIDFLVHTNDEEMVGKLADLAIDTEYIIAVQDNVTTVQTTVDMQEKTYTYQQLPNGENGEERHNIENFVDWHTATKTITVKETVRNKIELTYADSWFVRFSKTSSYAEMNLNSASGNNLTADQGAYLGEFLITEYCYACNDDGAGNFGTTATASGRPATENLSIAVNPNVFRNPNSPLHNGSYIIINGNVYRVDDCGPTWRPEKWADIYISTQNGKCVCDANYYTSAYIATNVREKAPEDEDNSEDNSEENSEETNIEEKNIGLKGINTVATVNGKVEESTTQMEETLETIKADTGYAGSQNVTERKKITTVKTISNEYDSGKEEIERKEQGFIEAFLSSDGILNRFNMGWMEEMLAQDEKTVNMIDLTKYLYQKAQQYNNNQEKDDEGYNFDVYKNNDLTHIYNSSDILEEFIKALENNPLRLYMNNHTSVDEGEISKYIDRIKDETVYKMLTNEFDGRGFGFNIFHRTDSTTWDEAKPYGESIVEHYENLGIDIKKYVELNQTLESSTVDQVMRKEIQKWKDVLEESIKNRGITLEEYQLDALTSIAYEYGWSEKDTDSFINAYFNYYITGNKKAFQKNFYIAERTVQPFYVVSDIGETGEKEKKEQLRANLRWNLFDSGEYKTPEGEILDPDSFHGINGEFLEVAEECWKQVCEADPNYAMAGVSIPWDKNVGTIDCSSYVSWVFYEYGMATGNDALVQEFQGGQHSTVTLQDVDWDKMGFEVIPVSAGENVTSILQPGDVLVRGVGDMGSGHTQIIADIKDGQVYVYDCGPSHWKGANGNPVTSNFASTSSWPGVIIREK